MTEDYLVESVLWVITYALLTTVMLGAAGVLCSPFLALVYGVVARTKGLVASESASSVGVPVASAEASLSPLELVASARTVYSVSSVKPVIFSAYRSTVEVDWRATLLVAGLLVVCRDESYCWLPDFHWILYEVVSAASDEDQRTSRVWLE